MPGTEVLDFVDFSVDFTCVVEQPDHLVYSTMTRAAHFLQFFKGKGQAFSLVLRQLHQFLSQSLVILFAAIEFGEEHGIQICFGLISFQGPVIVEHATNNREMTAAILRDKLDFRCRQVFNLIPK